MVFRIFIAVQTAVPQFQPLFDQLQDLRLVRLDCKILGCQFDNKSTDFITQSSGKLTAYFNFPVKPCQQMKPIWLHLEGQTV